MFEKLKNVFKGFGKKEKTEVNASKNTAKERLHLVLMQDRANVSADFLELMKQEIIEVIKKYIDVDENAIDVRLTNKDNGDGTKGAPALYANIPIMNIKEEVKKNNSQDNSQQTEVNKEEPKVEEKKTTKEKKKKDNIEIPKTDEEKESQEENIHEDQENQNEKVVVQNTEN